MVSNIIFRLAAFFEKSYGEYKLRKLKSRFKHCGNGTKISNDVIIWSPENFEIGENSHINAYTFIFASGGVSIGKNTLISCNVSISSVTHPKDEEDRTDKLIFEKVTIGNNVWIGMGAVIMPGVVIEDNSIIGAGSVVTKSVPPNSILVGVPAAKISNVKLGK